MIITIDGPVASGKSSVARELAKKLGLKHINSGMFYRGLAYILLNYFGYTLDSLKVISVKDLEEIFKDGNIKYIFENGSSRLIYDDRDLTIFLRSPEVQQAASVIALDQEVRNFINKFMHDYASNGFVVADGRDMGSVVFPEAKLKFFVTADVKIRAERWQKDQLKKGRKYTLEQALDQVKARDERDQNRKIAPLVIFKNAIVVDNSNLDVVETLSQILNYF